MSRILKESATTFSLFRTLFHRLSFAPTMSVQYLPTTVKYTCRRQQNTRVISKVAANESSLVLVSDNNSQMHTICNGYCGNGSATVVRRCKYIFESVVVFAIYGFLHSVGCIKEIVKLTVYTKFKVLVTLPKLGVRFFLVLLSQQVAAATKMQPCHNQILGRIYKPLAYLVCQQLDSGQHTHALPDQKQPAVQRNWALKRSFFLLKNRQMPAKL